MVCTAAFEAFDEFVVTKLDRNEDVIFARCDAFDLLIFDISA